MFSRSLFGAACVLAVCGTVGAVSVGQAASSDAKPQPASPSAEDVIEQVSEAPAAVPQPESTVAKVAQEEAQSFWWRGRSGRVQVALGEPGMKVLPPPGTPENARYRWVELVTRKVSAQGELSVEAPEVVTPPTVGAYRLEVAEKTTGKRAPKFRAVGIPVITRTHFANDRTHLNGYHIGRHPGRTRTGEYAAPERFVEVPKRLASLQVSEHFTLGQFLTKDQKRVWPKYIPLDARLLDKLELIIDELRAEGIPARRVHVMSGYRTPQYNGPGGRGRAKFSRHTYGDAADIWVDDDGDGYMDDLNRDGRRDDYDAEFLARISTRVEEKYPELAGGAGIYKSRPHRGPFTHVDVRGTQARWSLR